RPIAPPERALPRGPLSDHRPQPPDRDFWRDRRRLRHYWAMGGLTLNREVHESLRTAFERDFDETAGTLQQTFSGFRWLTEDQLASLIEALSRCCQADFPTIEAARNS